MIAFFRKLFGKRDAPVVTTKRTAPAGECDLPAFVHFVAGNLVETQKQVKVTSERDDLGLLIHVDCVEGQAGRVIGRRGRTITAIQGLVRAANAGKRQKTKVIVNG